MTLTGSFLLSLITLALTIIMKGLVFDIRSFSVHDGPGIRLTVFLKGCPLRCQWCHNPESQMHCPEEFIRVQRVGDINHEVKETMGKYMNAIDVVNRALVDKPFFEESGGGITLSGGEPLMQIEFTTEILQACKQHSLHTVIDTSGYAETKDFQRVIPFTDIFLYDLKLMDPTAHIKFTGKSNQLIHNNLITLLNQKRRVFIRIPLIQDITDTSSNLDAIRQFLDRAGGVERIDLLPYHHTASGKYERLQKPFMNSMPRQYDPNKAEKIRLYFSETADYVSVGG